MFLFSDIFLANPASTQPTKTQKTTTPRFPKFSSAFDGSQKPKNASQPASQPA